ncbi:N-alpha-acetyltransferase 20 [Nosema granulosis]|uniref:N-alpha-acetyltransferase 20 n=1 Tax=Nosema granulosis TaxID=83296 RepID=A0A9P6KZM3_9MICR|nr:N-alpha-acetyltransferase 20 [Nosema granulosis]
MLQYRKLIAEDIKYVKPLIDLNLSESVPYLYLLNKIIEKNGFNYVCLFRDQIVAFLASELSSQNTLTIEYICVDKEFRNCGIATDLINIIKKDAKKMVSGIELYVRKDNLKAINFYLKRGFVVLKRDIPYYENGALAFLMSCDV